MKKLKAIILSFIFCLTCGLLAGCEKFEFGSDKFYLKSVQNGLSQTIWYTFYKEVRSDINTNYMTSDDENGYLIYCIQPAGSPYSLIDSVVKVDKNKTYACLLFYTNATIDLDKDTKAEIHFEFTVRDTGERICETWYIDFTQTPFRDYRDQ